MLPRSPIGHQAHLAGLHEIIQQEALAQARLEQAAHGLEVQGRDSTAIRRRLQGSRPVMGSLRLMRPQVIAAKWRTEACPHASTPT